MKLIQIVEPTGDGQSTPAQGRELALIRQNGVVVARVLAAGAGIGRGADDCALNRWQVSAAPGSGETIPPTPEDPAAETPPEGKAEGGGVAADSPETVVAVVAYDAEGRPITDQAHGQQPPPRPAVELSLAIDAREETPLQHSNPAATASRVTPPGTPGVTGATGISTWVARLTGRMTLEVIARRGGFDGRQTAFLRLRIPQARQIHASYLFSDWWTRPAFPRQMADVPTRTQFLLWERTNGLFCCLIPLVNGELRASLQGAATGADPRTSGPTGTSTGASFAPPAGGDFTAEDLDIMVATEKSGLNSFAGVLFVLGAGPDPYSLVKAVYTRALQTLNLREAAGKPVVTLAPAPLHVARGREEKPYPAGSPGGGWMAGSKWRFQRQSGGRSWKLPGDQWLPGPEEQDPARAVHPALLPLSYLTGTTVTGPSSALCFSSQRMALSRS
ncbi:MAG TPA: hypothetical protein GXX55_11595 [Firmicutes bacterium]|nr:hypothetical protein [Bacillota bacterium]